MKYPIYREKIKDLIRKKFKVDLTGKIYLVKSTYDVPMSFDQYIHPDVINRWINNEEPLYAIRIGKYEFLYQEQNDRPFVVSKVGVDFSEREFMDAVGLSPIGLTMKQLIDIYGIN